MQHAAKAGHDVRVLTSTHRDGAVTAADEPYVRRTLRWYWDWEQHAFPKLPIADRLRTERANALEMTKQLDEFCPDIVTWWSMGHMSLSLIELVRQRSLPAAFSIHNDWLVYGWKADQWIRIWQGRRRRIGRVAASLTRIPTKVDLASAGPLLFNSRYTRDRAAVAGVDTSNARIIHPGIDERFLDPLPIEPWSWKLLYVGRIDRFKGIDTAVDALTHLPHAAHLAIHGRGDPIYLDELRGQAERLSLEDRVTLGGFCDLERLREVYSAADVILFPVRGDEPWGLVPLEAMGLQRPVISTAMGGTREFVRHERNALVIKPNDPKGLAQAVLRLASDEQLRHTLLRGGLDTASEHTAAQFDRQTLNAFLRVAETGSPTT